MHAFQALDHPACTERDVISCPTELSDSCWYGHAEAINGLKLIVCSERRQTANSCFFHPRQLNHGGRVEPGVRGSTHHCSIASAVRQVMAFDRFAVVDVSHETVQP